MDIVTIDTETYYSKEFSLSKMTTEEYIRAPEFEVIGVGVKVNDHPADWYSGDDIGGFLKSLDYSNKAILCHNTVFDGAILSWHFGIKPRLWLDTLSMARPIHNVTVGGSLKALAEHYKLGAKGTEVLDAIGKRRVDFTPSELAAYGRYCVNDVELTYQLWRRLRKLYRHSELQVIDTTIRMFTEPTIELDRALLEQHLHEVRESKSKLIAALSPDGNEDRVKDILMSNDKFAALLQALKVDPPTKVSTRTGKQAWAFSKTDKEFTDLLDHPNPKVQAAVSARLGTKSTIEETRTENLIGVSERGRLPIMLNYWGAHTGRFSGGDGLNLQNLPARKNNTIRRALRAPQGHKIIACDSSQIEARIVAWSAGQADLVQAFREGRDVYSEFATMVYGRTITKDNPTERFVGKTCILGLGYGMGAVKFRATLELGGVKIDEHEAERIVKLYRETYWCIPRFWQACQQALGGMIRGERGVLADVCEYGPGGIRFPNHMFITYPQLRQTGNGFEYINDRRELAKHRKGEEAVFTKIYGGKVAENLVQGLAAQVIREQMVEAVYAKLHVALQVHDEIVIVAPDAVADEAEAKLIKIMSTPPGWAHDLPVACDWGMADNYGDT